MLMKSGSENLVQSVERAMAILEELAKDKNGCGVTALSNALGLHKSTTHRLLVTLMNKGYVEKDIETDNYRLGIKILTLAGAVFERMDVRTIAKPYIQELSKRTNETVHLAILDHDEAFYIDKVESPRLNGIRLHSQIGKRIPLHSTAVGKVLLSDLEKEKVVNLLKVKGMPKLTLNTIDNIEDYLLELEKVKSQGFAYDEIENEEGIRCVAAPIFDRKGKVVAAISISGAIIYATIERMPELTKEVVETAKEISRQLGYI
jgi:DNA-binding IclR family transcriptional regulator